VVERVANEARRACQDELVEKVIEGGRMKLWIVVQWGNEKEGPDGQDTQCIVRSNDMMSAIEFAEDCFRGPLNDGWKNGKADVVLLLGDDNAADDGMTTLIVRIWVNTASYGGDYFSWHRKLATKEWVDAKTMFGDQ
jgi:hypothetical protein